MYSYEPDPALGNGGLGGQEMGLNKSRGKRVDLKLSCTNGNSSVILFKCYVQEVANFDFWVGSWVELLWKVREWSG